MRRTLGGLIGLALTATIIGGTVTATAHATSVAASVFSIGIVADEGSAPVAGSKVSFEAALMSGESPIAGAPVTLTARPYGASGFTPIAHTTTKSDGSARVLVLLRRSTAVRWTFDGDAGYAPTTSHPYVRTIGAKVRGHAVDGTLTRAQSLVVRGRSYPAKPGSRVSLWRGSVPCFCVGTGSTLVAVGTVRPDGTFRLTAKFAHPGTKKLYVRMNGGGGTTIGYSPYIRLQVR